MELLLVVIGLILLVVIAIIWVLANSQKGDPATNDRLTDDIETFARNLDFKPKLLEVSQKNVKAEKNKVDAITSTIDNSPFAWVPVENNYKEEVKEAEVVSPKVESKSSKVKLLNDVKVDKNEFTVSILLVDDSPTVLNFTGKMLARRGYEVITKVDGQEAYDYLLDPSTHMPDVIISDIEMPNKNGITLIKELRELKRFQNVPIIIISASAEKHFEMMSKGLIQGFLHKPFKEEDLLSQLKFVSSTE